MVIKPVLTIVNQMSNFQNELGKEKYFANRGIARNKTRLPNLRIKVEIRKNTSNYGKDKFRQILHFKRTCKTLY